MTRVFVAGSRQRSGKHPESRAADSTLPHPLCRHHRPAFSLHPGFTAGCCEIHRGKTMSMFVFFQGLFPLWGSALPFFVLPFSSIVLLSLYSSMSLCITSQHLNLCRPIFRCSPSIFHVLIILHMFMPMF